MLKRLHLDRLDLFCEDGLLNNIAHRQGLSEGSPLADGSNCGTASLELGRSTEADPKVHLPVDR